MGSHLIDGEFQSDKYPETPRGLVPLKPTDKMAQDLLWEYAQRRRDIDAEFSDDLEQALRNAGYKPIPHEEVLPPLYRHNLRDVIPAEHHKSRTPEKNEPHFVMNRVRFWVTKPEMTVREIKRLDSSLFGKAVDLYQIIPGDNDKKFDDEDTVKLRPYIRFFTAPKQISQSGS